LKIKHDRAKDAEATPPQLAFNYIKDWTNVKLRVNLETENPEWEDKVVFQMPWVHSDVIFGTKGKGSIRNMFTDSSRTAGAFCNIPNTNSCVGFFSTVKMTDDAKSPF
jgi:hypothetical protein